MAKAKFKSITVSDAIHKWLLTVMKERRARSIDQTLEYIKEGIHERQVRGITPKGDLT